MYQHIIYSNGTVCALGGHIDLLKKYLSALTASIEF